MGEAQPQPNAGFQRDRDWPLFEAADFVETMTPEQVDQEEHMREELEGR